MGRHPGPLKEHYTQSLSTIHDNFNLVVSIDIKTTGIFPGHDSIYEVCILPLGSYLDPYEELMPYYTQIIPYHMDNLSEKTKKSLGVKQAIIQGVEYGMSIDSFDAWFDSLPLNLGKKLMPLCYNWPFIQSFFLDWLGFRHMNHCFDYRFRDLLSVAHYLNDFSDSHIRTYPFKKIDYSYLCSVCDIEHERKNTDTLENCVNISKIYKQMLRDAILHLPPNRGPLNDDPELLDIHTNEFLPDQEEET